ncbi:MAG: hypothetical protein KatS3mg072_2590 [Meiothermus sp.]|nr:MAG: hypothetical protein KatS3mg072_2590 [Meiothermus sp.]
MNIIWEARGWPLGHSRYVAGLGFLTPYPSYPSDQSANRPEWSGNQEIGMHDDPLK